MLSKSTVGFLAYFVVALVLAFYFAFAAIRGNLGVLERLSIEADVERLEQQRDSLQAEVDVLANKTHRLSDDYLDLDLLDERARAVLGLMRNDELAIR
jgi:cell division protein FtsB